MLPIKSNIPLSKATLPQLSEQLMLSKLIQHNLLNAHKSPFYSKINQDVVDEYNRRPIQLFTKTSFISSWMQRCHCRPKWYHYELIISITEICIPYILLSYSNLMVSWCQDKLRKRWTSINLLTPTFLLYNNNDALHGEILHLINPLSKSSSNCFLHSVIPARDRW